MSQSTEEVREVEWAVRWTPSSALMSTNARPPWSADYPRWARSDAAAAYRRERITLITTTVEESEWVEATA